MAVDGFINASGEMIPELIIELGKLGKWLQALGIIILLWLIFQIVSLIIRIKKNKKLKDIQHRLSNLERKIDKVLKKR